MGLFSSYTPRISSKEFLKVRSYLRSQGFSGSEVERVAQIFRGDIEESGQYAGIDREELSKGMQWMREHPSSHGISPKKSVKVHC